MLQPAPRAARLTANPRAKPILMGAITPLAGRCYPISNLHPCKFLPVIAVLIPKARRYMGSDTCGFFPYSLPECPERFLGRHGGTAPRPRWSLRRLSRPPPTDL